MASEYSRRSRAASDGSGKSVGNLSERDVQKLKKLAEKQEKDEKKNNICLRVRGANEEVDKTKVEGWIQEKLKVKCGLEWVRKRGAVVGAKVGSEEEKREVMQKKSMLKGTQFFIDNDRTWEERKAQDLLVRKARELKAKGKDVRVGMGKLRIEGAWVGLEEFLRREQSGAGFQ